MAVLIARLASVAVCGAASCYAPDVADCTVTCTGETDCVAGQTCGADHFCAAPAIAGHCKEPKPPSIDAGRPTPTKIDAQPPHPTSDLHVRIDGSGRVAILGGPTCDSESPQDGDCHFVVLTSVSVTLTAIPHGGQKFDKWSGETCGGEELLCTFTPTPPSDDVHARFEPAH